MSASGVQGRKLPAYAKLLIEKRRQGLAPCRDLLIACDWNVGKAWPWRIVVAPDDDPSALDFTVVAGLSCLLLGRDLDRMNHVAYAVIPFAPAALVGGHLGGSRILVYVANPLVPCASPTIEHTESLSALPESEHAA